MSSQEDSSVASTQSVLSNPYSTSNQPHQTRPQRPQRITLYDWIKPILPGSSQPRQHQPSYKKQPTINNSQSHRRQHFQQILYPDTTNDHWGDELSSHPTLFRVVSKNVNSISPNDHLLQWHGVAQATIDYQISVLCLQEPNTKWDDHLRHSVHKILQRTHVRAEIVMANSTEPSNTNRQPGGTFIAINGSYTSRIISRGQDPSGMDRWSFVELLGKNNKRFVIISAYRTCSQTAHIGSNTATTQQTQILLRLGHHNPTPRTQMITDLIKQIQTWQLLDREILLCMDVNDDTSHPNVEDDFGCLLAKTGLIDLHRARFPHVPTPATHTRGRLTIDTCLGTQLFVNALLGAWFLPFGTPVMLPGDHCTLGLDFNHDILFGNKLPIPTQGPERGIYSNDMPTVREFNDRVSEACENANLFKEAHALYCKYTFTPSDHERLEHLDQTLTNILIQNNQNC